MKDIVLGIIDFNVASMLNVLIPSMIAVGDTLYCMQHKNKMAILL